MKIDDQNNIDDVLLKRRSRCVIEVGKLSSIVLREFRSVEVRFVESKRVGSEIIIPEVEEDRDKWKRILSKDRRGTGIR